MSVPEMAKRKPSPVAEEVEAEVLSSSLSDDAPKKKRSGYFIPLTEDGQLDVVRLRGDTERVEAVRAALGANGAGAVTTPGLQINPELAGYLYDGVSKVIQLFGINFLHWPVDFAILMRYSDESKKKLGPPTTKVIEHYAPVWLAKNQDAAMLAMALATETQAMVQNALVEYGKTHTMPVKPNGHATQEPKAEA